MCSLPENGQRGRRPGTGHARRPLGKVHCQCVVVGCHSMKSTPKHCFPKDWRLSNLWKEALQNPALQHLGAEELRTYRICQIHFSEKSYSLTSSRKTLRNDAVPELLLGPMPSTSDAFNDMDLAKEPEMIVTEENVSNDLKEDPAEKEDAMCETPKLARKRSLLGSITRRKQLTPVASRLHKIATNLLRRQTKHVRQLGLYKDRLQNAAKFVKSSQMRELQTLSKQQLTFIEMQIQNVNKKAKARRFSLDEKILALAILKQSAQCYRLLSRIFILPTPRSLRTFLGHIPLKAGMNDVIISHLKEQGKNMADKDKVCVLLWDEMSLDSQLYYDGTADRIIGFEDWGNARTDKIADHALVFMLRGIQKNWIIPISYNFCKSCTSATQLIHCIRSIVAGVTKAGFKIVATVCDQGATNVSCIRRLLQETKAKYLAEGRQIRGRIEICGQTIIPLYDTPHLLKGIRNNLMTKHLEIVPEHISAKDIDETDLSDKINKYLITTDFIDEIKEKVCNVEDYEEGATKMFASWDIIELAYDIDTKLINVITKQMRKLSDRHIRKDKIPKMRVKVAAQTLSNSVAAFIRFTTGIKGDFLTIDGPKTMPVVEGVTTSVVVKFFNDVFDSVNGTKHQTKDQTNDLRRPVTDRSLHAAFWRRAANCIRKSLRFVDPVKKIPKIVPSMKNWASTLHGFIRSWAILKNLGFKEFSPRHINQDSLENWFRMIRSHGRRNINPTCLQFATSHKSLLINNLTSAKTVKGNCADDGSEALFSLRNLAVLAQNYASTESTHLEENIENMVDDENRYVLFHDLQSNRTGTCINKSRILTKLNNSKSKNCQHCMHSICHFNNLNNFNSFCKEAYSVLEGNIPLFCFKPNVVENLKMPLLLILDYSFIKCETHSEQLINEINTGIVTEYVISWCKYINKLLKGNDSGTRAQAYLSKQAILQFKKTLYKKNR